MNDARLEQPAKVGLERFVEAICGPGDEQHTSRPGQSE
jgi:hypothetical protein